MFCSKCGNSVPDGSRFCAVCGTPAEPAQQKFFKPAPSLTDESEAPAVPTPAYGEPIPAYEEPTPMYDEPAADAYDYEYYEPEEAPKPKKKKRFILLGIAAALVLAMFVSVIAFAVVRSTPKAKLLRAVKKNGADLTEILEEGKHFTKTMKNASSLIAEKKFTMKMENSTTTKYDDYYESENKTSAQYNYNLKKEQMTASIAVDSRFSFNDDPEDAQNIDFRVELYADRDMLAASMPGTLSAAYSVPMEGLGYKLSSSKLGDLLEEEMDEDSYDALTQLDVNLFADTSWKAFKKANPNQAKNFMKSLEVEKTNYFIPNARNNKMDIYSINWDKWAFKEMAVSYMLFTMDARFGQGFSRNLKDYEKDLRESLDEFIELDIRVYAGIHKGTLVALHIEVNDEGYDSDFTLLWEGTKNVWESVRVYEDGEELLYGGARENANGFELWAEVEGEKISISCLDSAGELFINVDGESFIVKYGHENKGCQIQFEQKSEYSEYYSSKVSVSIELLPMEKIQKPEFTIDALTLDEEDLEEIADKIEAKFD